MSALPNTHRSKLLQIYLLLIELNSNTADRGEFGDQARPAAEPGQNQSARQGHRTMRRVIVQTKE